MLAKRIIACLDVKDGKVVKGVKFKQHQVVGDILSLARRYRQQCVDELVFYDITASSERRSVSREWIRQTARELDIPFCVAGGLRTVGDVREVLEAGADKISINSPALKNPSLIDELVKIFGSQCIVVGVDSLRSAMNDNTNRTVSYEGSSSVSSNYIPSKWDYTVYQYTGSEKTIQSARRKTMEWLKEVQDRGAGEVVLNCMSNDGVGTGYDIEQLKTARELLQIPLIASGGAGNNQHFIDVLSQANVDGALAAGVFHRNEIQIDQLKENLHEVGIEVRR